MAGLQSTDTLDADLAYATALQEKDFGMGEGGATIAFGDALSGDLALGSALGGIGMGGDEAADNSTTIVPKLPPGVLAADKVEEVISKLADSHFDRIADIVNEVGMHTS